MGNRGFFGFSGPAARPSDPDQLPANPTPWDDEFDQKQLDQRWVKRGSATTTISLSMSHLLIKHTNNSSRINGYEQPICPGPWLIRAKYNWEGPGFAYVGPGIWMRDSASGRLVWMGIMWHSSYGYYAPCSLGLSDFGALVNQNYISSWVISQRGYLQVYYDGSTFTLSHSVSGVHFMGIISETQAYYLGATPTHIGLGCHLWTGDVAYSWDWVRKMPIGS